MVLKKEEVIVIALAIILFLGFIFLVKPSTIGYVVHSPTSNDYNYNSSLVNFSDSQIKLIPTITSTTTSTTNENIVSLNNATQEGNNELSKVNSTGNSHVEIEENDNEY